jgi:hypothetical protein
VSWYFKTEVMLAMSEEITFQSVVERLAREGNTYALKILASQVASGDRHVSQADKELLERILKGLKKS